MTITYLNGYSAVLFFIIISQFVFFIALSHFQLNTYFFVMCLSQWTVSSVSAGIDLFITEYLLPSLVPAIK